MLYFTVALIILGLLQSAFASPILHSSTHSRRNPTHGHLPFPARLAEWDPSDSMAEPSDGLQGRNETEAVGLAKRASVKELVNSIKAEGTSESVKVTWYSGNGLLDPSCWAEAIWQPTDTSYVCALTLEGWSDKPKCFTFLELCNGSKCVSCRVVDTCAGCQGKHVDVSQATFEALAPLSQGVIEGVKMRLASKPAQWCAPINDDAWSRMMILLQGHILMGPARTLIIATLHFRSRYHKDTPCQDV
ncbi:hypothetical protein CALCODRAFT_6684 [Calocera cornea HHB12733]|uniref:RlpA-like protein double-psi beta-barrel domain-containing protein n=1 Tax=Calocera cornea HHB12733 TaxID=1353952 RepID=A0A165KCI5_9BASI|nr:hypothetical protein CALCODRAFT_6684 [Calocera cornea HHB12733]